MIVKLSAELVAKVVRDRTVRQVVGLTRLGNAERRGAALDRRGPAILRANEPPRMLSDYKVTLFIVRERRAARRSLGLPLRETFRDASASRIVKLLPTGR